jgi:hypothetical protein
VSQHFLTKKKKENRFKSTLPLRQPTQAFRIITHIVIIQWKSSNAFTRNATEMKIRVIECDFNNFSGLFADFDASVCRLHLAFGPVVGGLFEHRRQAEIARHSR